LVIFGGYTEQGYTNDVFVINLLEDRFENPLTTGAPPSPRESFSTVFANDKMYIFGGFQEGSVLNDIYTLDINSWTWKKLITKGPIPPPRQGFGSTRVGKKIFVSGGCDFNQQKCFTDTFYLDLDSLWWTKIENK
jgi:N-acetylneuraminic acid mutarotase